MLYTVRYHTAIKLQKSYQSSWVNLIYLLTNNGGEYVGMILSGHILTL